MAVADDSLGAAGAVDWANEVIPDVLPLNEDEALPLSAEDISELLAEDCCTEPGEPLAPLGLSTPTRQISGGRLESWGGGAVGAAQVALEEGAAGPGFQFSKLGDRNIISAVLEDGSAHLEGTLLPGDEILAVDSKAVAGLSAPQIRTALLGPQGSPVSIRIRKAGAQGEAREVDVHLARGSPSFFAQQRREQQLHLEAHALREELSTRRGSEQRRLDWEDEARSLRSGLASARAETTSLRRGLEDAQRANKRLDARLEMLTEREAEMRARRDELEREISRRDAHSAQHGAGREMETGALQRSLEETGEMLETRTARCAELEGEVHRLQEDLRRSQLRVATLEAREAQLEQLLIVQADEATLAHAELVKKNSAHVAELEAALDELRSGLLPKENAATTTNKVASAESAALHRLGREHAAGNGVLDAHGDDLNDVNAGANLGLPHTAARKVSLPETKVSLPNKANEAGTNHHEGAEVADSSVQLIDDGSVLEWIGRLTNNAHSDVDNVRSNLKGLAHSGVSDVLDFTETIPDRKRKTELNEEESDDCKPEAGFAPSRQYGLDRMMHGEAGEEVQWSATSSPSDMRGGGGLVSEEAAQGAKETLHARDSSRDTNDGQLLWTEAMITDNSRNMLAKIGDGKKLGVVRRYAGSPTKRGPDSRRSSVEQHSVTELAADVAIENVDAVQIGTGSTDEVPFEPKHSMDGSHWLLQEATRRADGTDSRRGRSINAESFGEFLGRGVVQGLIANAKRSLGQANDGGAASAQTNAHQAGEALARDMYATLERVGAQGRESLQRSSETLAQSLARALADADRMRADEQAKKAAPGDAGELYRHHLEQAEALPEGGFGVSSSPPGCGGSREEDASLGVSPGDRLVYM